MSSFHPENYQIEEKTFANITIRYRAFRDIPYVQKPIDPNYQKLNLYVPEAFYKGESINGYTLETAPVFVPNAVGGYMPGEIEEPGYKLFGEPGTINSLFWALHHGYVVVSPAIRGRTQQNKNGKFTGKAPAAIVDYKAAIRYLHHFDYLLPGDQNKIITNGTSAGGALSSLMATTINHPDFLPYLKEIGAYDGGEEILAASCYCPITNLDHADMAYEWQFNHIQHYSRMNMDMDAGGRPSLTPEDGDLTPLRLDLSNKLKANFPNYLNSLNLTDEKGHALTLDDKGNGSFKDYLCSVLLESAKAAGIEDKDIPWINDGKVNFDAFAADITRMKTPPAFDDVSGDSAENELFGDINTNSKHFTAFSYQNTTSFKELADSHIVKLLNPMNYIEDEKATTAAYIRIRHGQRDRDTSLAISAILTLKLRNNGHKVDYHAPWGVEHDGDYDLEQLFEWIDGICATSEKQ